MSLIFFFVSVCSCGWLEEPVSCLAAMAAYTDLGVHGHDGLEELVGCPSVVGRHVRFIISACGGEILRELVCCSMFVPPVLNLIISNLQSDGLHV